MDYEEILKRKKANEKSSDRSKYIKNLWTRILVCIILVLGSTIYIKYSNTNLLAYKKQVFETNLSFTTIKNFYEKHFGESVILKDIVEEQTVAVFNEKLEYKEESKFYDGVKLTVNDAYLVPIIESGLVVFIGDKENYGKTVIIQGVNGVDYWYGNVQNLNVNLYDYVEQGTLLGETLDNNLYLAFMKDGAALNYEEYIK